MGWLLSKWNFSSKNTWIRDCH